VTSTTPGPGTYRADIHNTKGIPMLSEHKYKCMALMSQPMQKKHFERKVADDHTKDIPGPGSYTPASAVMNSQLANGAHYKFYQNERKIVLKSGTINENPGPGTYLAPSDFGYPLKSSKSRINLGSNQSMISMTPSATGGPQNSLNRVMRR
jgi:hypothetical protein